MVATTRAKIRHDGSFVNGFVGTSADRQLCLANRQD